MIWRNGNDLAANNDAVFALLFGSYARGTETEHLDLDVIFIEETNKLFLSKLDPYFSFVLYVSAVMGFWRL